jgi:glycerophosphoryl diester phosphodiesterase
VNLHRGGRRPLVIGHRGAAALAPANTLASLAAAVEAGADLVEFDVGGDLTLAHSPWEIPDDPISLDQALEFLRERAAGVHLDVKRVGIEQQVVDALRRHGLAERSVVSAAFVRSVRRVAAAAPELSRAIGYPRDRYGIADLRWPDRLTAAAAAALRRVMPLRVPLLVRIARANVLSLHHALVSRATVSAAHALGAPVLAWTANDSALVERLVFDGVDGIVSDDPRMVLETLATLNRP